MGEGDLNFPINARLNISVDARLPHRGKDGRNPVFVDRFTSLERLGGQFAPRGGPIHAEIPLQMNKGVLDLSGDIIRFGDSAGIGRLNFFDVGGRCISGNIISADGTLFAAESVRLTDEGVPRIFGKALGIAPFDDEIRLVGEHPYTFPFGLNASGKLICHSANRDSVTEPFPYSTAIRLGGLPHSWTLSSILALSEEMNKSMAVGGCDPDPHFDFSNVPDWIKNDPLMMIRQASVDGRLTAHGKSIKVPALLGNEPMTINFGEGTNSLSINASYNNPELQAFEDGNRNAEELAALRYQREARAQINTQFDLASVVLGEKEITLPVSGNLNVDAQLQGLFPSRNPENIWAQVALNGYVTLNGDIVVPAMEGTPEIRIRRGKDLTQLSANYFTATYDNGFIDLNGEINADFDFDEVQIGDVKIPGPHKGRFDLYADDYYGVIAELSARMTLPREGYPIPMKVALDRGYLEVSGHLALDSNYFIMGPDGLPEHISGAMDATIALRDVEGKALGHAIKTDASVSINNSFFMLDDGLLYADASLIADVSSSVDGQKNELSLKSDFSLNDYRKDDPSHGEINWRDITVNNVGGSLSLNFGDLTIDAPEGSFGDPLKAALLNGEVLMPGIHISADRVGLNLGRDATLKVNTHVNGVRVKTPQGTFELSGQLVGQLSLVNISKDPASPDLKPVAGKTRFELRHGSITQIEGRRRIPMLARGTLEISDNAKGEIRVVAHAAHPASQMLSGFGLSGLSSALGIPKTVSTKLNIPSLQIGPEGIHSLEVSPDDPDQIVGPGPEGEHASTASPIPYYDPNTVDSVNASTILFRMIGGGSTLLAARGRAQITGLQSDTPVARYKFAMPLPNQKIRIQGGEIRVDAGKGSVGIEGTNENMKIRVKPPSGFDIQFKQEKEGMTYEVTGRLTPTGAVDSSLTLNLDDPSKPTFSLHKPKNPYTLSGDFKVIVRNKQGDVIGSGEASMSTAYEVSGRMEQGRAHFSLDVPETVLSGKLTEGIEFQGTAISKDARLKIPIRGLHGEISVDARNPENPKLDSVWNLPSVGSGDSSPEVFIPDLKISGFKGKEGDFSDVNLDLHQDPQGQQVRIKASKKKGVSFEALPGDDGNPRMIRLSFSLGDAKKKIVITGTSESAAHVDGSLSPTGEIVVDVKKLSVKSEVDGHVELLELDLNNVDTLTKVPGLKAHYDPTTNKIRFTLNPPQPKLPLPPKTMEEFFSWPRERWEAYSQALRDETHLLRLSEANALVQRALGQPIPPGKGDILVNLTKPLDITLDVDNNLASNLMGALKEIADVRRALPAPPPCTRESCPAVILSDRQDGESTLYFIRREQKGGLPTIHPEVTGILQEALGIPRSDVENHMRDLRIPVSQIIQDMRKNKEVRDHYSEADLESLLTSYFPMHPSERGTFRQLDLRSLIGLANVRRSIGKLLKAKGGLFPIHVHVFRNDDYHSVSKGDGNDMQYLSILPVSVDQVEKVVTDTAQMGKWDHWVDQTERHGDQTKGRLLLNYDFTVTTSTSREGNVRVIHFHITPKSGSQMEAYTRTVRLVPVKNAVDPNTGQTVQDGTLLVFDEHSDFIGPDKELPFPRTRLPIKPTITWEGFLNGTFRTLEPETNVERHAANRFAVTSGFILEAAKDPKITASALRDKLTYNSMRAEQTETLRRIDFLSLDEKGEALIISETAQQGDVQSYLVGRLGIESSKVSQWMRPPADPTEKRKIPLEELREASGLDKQLGKEAFLALTRSIIDPPKAVSDIAANFGSKTERYILTLAQLKKRGTELRGPGHFGDILVFEDGRFHPNISQESRRQGDTVDSFNIWYIPENIQWRGRPMKLDIDKFISTIHHAEYYARTDPDNFTISVIIPHETLSNPSVSPSLKPGNKVDTSRIYTRSRIALPGGLELNYLISSIPKPITVEGVGRLSAWRLEPSPDLRDFLDDPGWWLIIPAEKGGYWVFRSGILNSRQTGNDNVGTIAEEGREGIVHFMDGILSSTLEYQATGNPTAWTVDDGKAIIYQVGEVPRIK